MCVINSLQAGIMFHSTSKNFAARVCCGSESLSSLTAMVTSAPITFYIVVQGCEGCSASPGYRLSCLFAPRYSMGSSCCGPLSSIGVCNFARVIPVSCLWQYRKKKNAQSVTSTSKILVWPGFAFESLCRQFFFNPSAFQFLQIE